MASDRGKIGMLCMVLGILWLPAYLKFGMITDIWFLSGIVSPWYVAIGLLIAGLVIYLTDDS